MQHPPIVKSKERPELIKTLGETLRPIAKGTPFFLENYYSFEHHLWEEPNQYYLDPIRGKFYIEIKTEPYPTNQSDAAAMNKKIVDTCARAVSIVKEFEKSELHSIECTLCEDQNTDNTTTWTFCCKFNMQSEWNNLKIEKIL